MSDVTLRRVTHALSFEMEKLTRRTKRAIDDGAGNEPDWMAESAVLLVESYKDAPLTVEAFGQLDEPEAFRIYRLAMDNFNEQDKAPLPQA